MENRYVYRSVEDGIGFPLTCADSPHASILRRLRRNFRESRDYTRYVETCAISKAAFYSHERFDASQCKDLVTEMLTKMFDGLFPYDKITKPAQQTQSKAEFYAECFRQLDEMNKKDKNTTNATNISENKHVYKHAEKHAS